MKTNGKTFKANTALGGDPFTDLPEWGQPDSEPVSNIDPEQVTNQADATIDTTEAGFKETSNAEAVRPDVAGDSQPVTTDQLGANNAGEIDGETELEFDDDTDLEAFFDDDIEFDDDTDLEAFFDDDTAFDDDTDLEAFFDDDTEFEDDVAPAPAIQNPQAALTEVEVLQTKNENDVLEELIATIDEKIEQALDAKEMDGQPTEIQTNTANQKQHVIFTLDNTKYAVPISNVTEIGRPLNITPTPNVPNWVMGVANLRGDVISMVDLRMFLDMEEIAHGQYSRMLIAQTHYEDMTTALIVDRVNEIRYLDLERITEPTAPIEDQVTSFLHGVYERDDQLLVVLDFDKLLLSPKMQQFGPV